MYYGVKKGEYRFLVLEGQIVESQRSINLSFFFRVWSRFQEGIIFFCFFYNKVWVGDYFLLVNVCENDMDYFWVRVCKKWMCFIFFFCWLDVDKNNEDLEDDGIGRQEELFVDQEFYFALIREREINLYSV